MSTERLDDVLALAEAIVVAGPGGVGKTTMAAALGVRAALEHDRRCLVVTVDPARRLLDALGFGGDDGLGAGGDEVLVPTERGRLWIQMLDTARGWDDLVAAVAPDDRTVNELLANPLYRSLTRRFVQSHDYIALDRLAAGDDDSGRFDLVIIDTPPADHALDIVDAPARLLEFFDSRLLRWLTAPYRSRVVGVAARPFLSVAERILGGAFLADIAEFFWLFGSLRHRLVDRTRTLDDRLRDPHTALMVVTTAEEMPRAEADRLMELLDERGLGTDLLIRNRVVGGDPAAALAEMTDDLSPEAVAALERVIEAGAVARRLDAGRDDEVLDVEWRADAPTTLAGLSAMLG